MKISFIKPSFEVTMPMSGQDMIKHLERCGRTCYKSEDKITDDSALAFVKMIAKRNHESVLEHAGFSVRIICDRGVSHELVRHRIASFSQESTRYVGYKNAIEFIIPSWTKIEPFEHDCDGYPDPPIKYGTAEMKWFIAMLHSSIFYSELLGKGWKPEQARSVLPNSLKTEIVITANLREWKHIFNLRDNKAAHPDMRAIMAPLHSHIQSLIPGVFDDEEATN